MNNTTKIAEAARALLKTQGFFVDNLWHVSDIHFICEQGELPSLSDEEAMEVFTIANENFDGDFGISWPQLDRSIRLYLARKNMRHGICETDPA